MTEVWFYHLEQQPLAAVLPLLLKRTLERGWRACIEATSPERVQALDEALWTFDDASFLPHGTISDGHPALQPILLIDDPRNLNGATIRFLVDGADPSAALAESAYERLILLFDGNDDEAVADARRRWSSLKQEGLSLTYWQQDGDGRWDKRA